MSSLLTLSDGQGPGCSEPGRPESVPMTGEIPWAVICDIDGTLALHDGRGPFEFEKCLEDRVNDPVLYALARFSLDSEIILLSGRPEDYRDQTSYWLNWHGVPWQHLWMRPSGDSREDTVIKSELYEAHIQGRYRVRMVLDDRDRVVRLWRGMGLPCWQVNDGDF